MQPSDFNLDATCRYSDNMQNLLQRLDAQEVLFKEEDDDYQGSLDVDVLLKDGRVFSYRYTYGSCSGCDEWEAEGYTDERIEEIIQQEATIFDDRDQYQQWAELARKTDIS